MTNFVWSQAAAASTGPRMVQPAVPVVSIPCQIHERGPRDDQRPRDLREDQPAVRQERDGQATAANAIIAARAPAMACGEVEDSQCGQRGEQAEEGHDAAIARGGERRRDRTVRPGA